MTWRVPSLATSAAGMAAVSCVGLTYVVERSAPSQCTFEPATKPEPVSVRVKAAPPTGAFAGLRDARTGIGLAMVKRRMKQVIHFVAHRNVHNCRHPLVWTS